MEAEKFSPQGGHARLYRFHFLNTITGETGHSVSKIPESDRQMWFEHLNRTESPLAYWAEPVLSGDEGEIKGEGEVEGKERESA